MTVERIFAAAKLTTRLSIVGVRDDGYHLIDAEMVTLDWGDDIDIEIAEETSLRFEGPPDLVDDVPLGSENLVWRALDLAGRTASVTVHKRIPAGAGLGGGSADAGAVLRWAELDDPALAAVIGADVPFCAVGGRARVTGIGERVDPLPARRNPDPITVVVPPINASTPAVYRRWNVMGGPKHETNDLEPAAVAEFPPLARWRAAIAAIGVGEPQLAGSGSSWFVPGDHADALSSLVVDGRSPRTVVTTTPLA